MDWTDPYDFSAVSSAGMDTAFLLGEKSIPLVKKSAAAEAAAGTNVMHIFNIIASLAAIDAE